MLSLARYRILLLLSVGAFMVLNFFGFVVLGL
jgi:hypothetical protein